MYAFLVAVASKRPTIRHAKRLLILILFCRENSQIETTKNRRLVQMEDGTTYLDEELTSMLQITPEYLEKEKAEQIQEIRRTNILYSIYRPINQYEHLEEKTVILVDDGAATGATLIAVARWLKMKHTPKPLVIAVPVAPRHTVKLLEHESDEVKVVISPSSIFRSVEQFYRDFEQVPDDRVLEILRIRNMLARI